MYFRRSLGWLVLVGLASCGPAPESTVEQPSALPADADPVGSVEDGVTFTPMALAAFDTSLGAPKCDTVSSVCDTGTLLNGRGAVGPETNAPNTINGSCPDGNIGVY
jgi:hypothetical protein